MNLIYIPKRTTLILLIGTLCWGTTQSIAINLSNKNAAANPYNDLLLSAAKNGLMDTLTEALQKGADVNAIDKNGHTALWWAMKHGHTAIAAELLKHGALQSTSNINKINKAILLGAFFTTLLGTIYFFVKWKIAQNSDHLHAGHSKHHAAHQNQNEHDAAHENQNATNTAPLTSEPLHNPLNNEHPHATFTDPAGLTPLHLAVVNNEKIIDKLVANGANINAADLVGWTPLHIAVENNGKLIDELVANGANINAVDLDGWTPLHVAAVEGYETVINQLIKNGANVNAIDNDGLTALWMATNKGHVTIIDQLIKNKANINTANHNGVTPLMQAAKKNNAHAVQTLLSNKADINLTNRRGQTALNIAIDLQCNAVIPILQN